MHPRLLRAALILLLAAPAAEAQTLRSVVVPADATVAVPPRGQLLPAPPAAAPTAPPPVAAAPPAEAPVPLAPGPTLGLAAGPGLLLPLSAGVLFGGALAGGGSGTSAPAGTR
jgi:hypothetical protein